MKALKRVLTRPLCWRELPDRALRRLDSEFPQTLASHAKIRQASATAHAVQCDPGRFLPVSVYSVVATSPSSFAEFANKAKPPHWTWPEVAAAQGPITPSGLGVFMETLFKEEAHISSLQRLGGAEHSFEDRLVHSDFAHLLPAYDLEDHTPGSAKWSEKPRKRLKALTSGLAATDDLQFIHRSCQVALPSSPLSCEVGLRYEVCSVLESWKSHRSGLSAWGSFTHVLHPLRDPFDLAADCIFGFSALFTLPGTVKEYLGRTKFGLRLLGRELALPQASLQQLLRGMAKCRPRREMPRLRDPEARRLVSRCLAIGRVSLARFFIVARNLSWPASWTSSCLFNLAGDMASLPTPRPGTRRSSSPTQRSRWSSALGRTLPMGHVSFAGAGSSRDPLCIYCILKTRLARSLTLTAAFGFLPRLRRPLGLPHCAPLWVSRTPAGNHFAAGWPPTTSLLASPSPSSSALGVGRASSAVLAQSELDRRESLEYALAEFESDGDSPSHM